MIHLLEKNKNNMGKVFNRTLAMKRKVIINYYNRGTENI